MIKNKKVVIFDLDGTLIDSIGIWSSIDKDLIEKIGNIEVDEDEIAIQRFRKMKEYSEAEDTYLEYCGFLAKKYNSNLKKEEVKKLRYDIAEAYLRENVDYKPNAENVIKYLKEKGYTLAIASATNSHIIDIYKKYNKNMISKANLDDYFLIIYSKSDVNKLKPNPEVYNKLLNELKVSANECLIVEDSLIGVEAANNAKIDVAVIYDKYSDKDREKINQLSQYQFLDFNEMLEYIKSELL